jgi:hypothetical protein
MHTFTHRQKGRAIGVESIPALRAFNNSRQANGDTEQSDPGSKQLPQSRAGGVGLKGNDQARHVDQDSYPQNPATAANFFQALMEGGLGDFSLFGQYILLK